MVIICTAKQYNTVKQVQIYKNIYGQVIFPFDEVLVLCNSVSVMLLSILLLHVIVLVKELSFCTVSGDVE